MAKEETTGTVPTGNGTAAPAGPPQLFINAQYIKDLSFENPRAPQSLIQQKAQPEVSLDVDVKARNLAPGLSEASLTMPAQAQADRETDSFVPLTNCAAGND